MLQAKTKIPNEPIAFVAFLYECHVHVSINSCNMHCTIRRPHIGVYRFFSKKQERICVQLCLRVNYFTYATYAVLELKELEV